jgi:CoA:oxalate CoA-transferase
VAAVPYNPQRSFSTGGWPGWNIYETEDGKYVAIGARNMRNWQKLCSLLNREKYAAFFQGDDSTNERIRKDFSEIFRSKPRDYWSSLFKQHGISGAPVYSLEEVEDDPQVKAREMLLELDLEKGRGVTQYGIPMKFSKTCGRVRHLARSYGQDTASILKAMGFSENRIKELRAIGAIA